MSLGILICLFLGHMAAMQEPRILLIVVLLRQLKSLIDLWYLNFELFFFYISFVQIINLRFIRLQEILQPIFYISTFGIFFFFHRILELWILRWLNYRHILKRLLIFFWLIMKEDQIVIRCIRIICGISGIFS